MTVKELIDGLQFLIERKFLSETDLVVMVGTGNVKSDFIKSISMPRVELTDCDPFKEKKGYCHIGFCENKDEYVMLDQSGNGNVPIPLMIDLIKR